MLGILEFLLSVNFLIKFTTRQKEFPVTHSLNSGIFSAQNRKFSFSQNDSLNLAIIKLSKRNSTMSEINDLKKQILQKLDNINDRYQLRTIHKMMDRIEEIEKCLKNKEQSLSRGNNSDFFREEIDFENLPMKSGELGDLVNQALNKLTDMENLTQ